MPRRAWNMSKVLPHDMRRDVRPMLRSVARPAGVITLRGLSTAAAKIAPNIGFPSSRPTASEVMANYTRGLVLLGHASSRLAPFVWNSFPMRSVITRETARIPERLRRYRRHSELEVRFNEDFEAIIHQCSEGRSGWLTPQLIDIYMEVYTLGFIATAGTYRGDQLVGGLWGLTVGRTVSVYSLFHRENRAGAFAMAALTDVVANDGRWSVIDCGTVTANTARYGASEITKNEFCKLVWNGLKYSG